MNLPIVPVFTHSLTVSEHIVVAQEVLNQDADVMTISDLM